MSGDFDEEMAKREVPAREAVLLRAEDQSHAAAAGKFGFDARPQIRQRDDRLLGCAAVEGAGADDQRRAGDGLGQGRRDSGALKEVFGADGRARLAPVGLVGSDDSKPRKAEVGHSPRRRSYIEGIARGDEDDLEAVALRFAEQENIVERVQMAAPKEFSCCFPRGVVRYSLLETKRCVQ